MVRRPPRSLVFESLDQRLPLAGNVNASVSGGVLQISAGDLDNLVAVWGGANAGQVTVAGVSQTTVNGTSSNKSFSGVNSIKFSLAGGNDQALVTRLNLAGGITFGAGNGDDRLVLRGQGPAGDFPALNQGSIPFGPLSIQSVDVIGGTGNDTLQIVSAGVRGLLKFTGGTGNDRVDVDGAKSANVFGRVDLRMEQGNDAVVIRSAKVTNPTSELIVLGIADVGTVDDKGITAKAELYNVEVTGRTVVTLTYYQTMFVRLGGGSATTGFSSTDGITLSGNDVAVKYTTTPTLELTGSDTRSDQVRIADSQFSNLKVTLGGADDKLTLTNVASTSSTVLNGGSGWDVYAKSGNNNLQGLQLQGFEVVPSGGAITSSQNSSTGRLTLNGSVQGTTLVVSCGAVPGRVIVYGADDTKIDGANSKTFNGVVELAFDLSSGADRLLLTKWNSTIPLFYVGGEGNDLLLIRSEAPATPFAALNEGSIQYGPVSGSSLDYEIADSPGNDTLRIVNAAFNGGIDVRANLFDRFEVDGDINKNNFSGGLDNKAIRIFGWGNTTSVKNARVAGLSVGGGGNLEMENVEVNGDAITRYQENLTLRNLTVTGVMEALWSGGQRAGQAVIEHVTSQSLDLSGGSFDGTGFTVRDVECDDLSIYTGSGDNTLTIGGTITHNSTSLDGGEGFDRFFEEAGNDFANLEFKGFEALG